MFDFVLTLYGTGPTDDSSLAIRLRLRDVRVVWEKNPIVGGKWVTQRSSEEPSRLDGTAEKEKEKHPFPFPKWLYSGKRKRVSRLEDQSIENQSICPMQ